MKVLYLPEYKMCGISGDPLSVPSVSINANDIYTFKMKNTLGKCVFYIGIYLCSVVCGNI